MIWLTNNGTIIHWILNSIPPHTPKQVLMKQDTRYSCPPWTGKDTPPTNLMAKQPWTKKDTLLVLE